MAPVSAVEDHAVQRTRDYGKELAKGNAPNMVRLTKLIKQSEKVVGHHPSFSLYYKRNWMTNNISLYACDV